MAFRPRAVVFVLLVSVILCMPRPSIATEPAGSVASWKQQLEAASRDRFRALVARDRGYLDKHYAPSFQLVGTDGRIESVVMLRQLIEQGAPDLNFEPFDYHVFVSADGSQGVVYHKSHDTEGGKRSVSEYTEVWVRTTAKVWMLQFEQYADNVEP